MRYGVVGLVFTFSVALNVCRAEISDDCATKVINPIVQRIVSDLKARAAETEDEKRQQLAQRVRNNLGHDLSQGTSLWICANRASGSDVGNRVDAQFASMLENRRIDVQAGTTNGGGGSTSLVPSGSVAGLLGLAVEYGGISESFNGTTVTFRTTPAKLLGAMAHIYGPDAPPPSDGTYAALQRVSMSVSFDTSRTTGASTDSGSELLANYQQLSQATVRILLIHDRDPLSPKNWREIRQKSTSISAQDFADAAAQLLGALTKQPAFDKTLDDALNAYDKIDVNLLDESVLKKTIADYFEEIQVITALIPDWRQRWDAYGAARLTLEKLNSDLYRKIAKAPTLSFEYDFTRPPAVSGTAADATPVPAVTAPDLSTMGLVYVASLFDSEYTLNATARFFNETQSGMSGNFRDFQLAGKWDIPVGRIPSFIAKGTLTFSGLFEHLHQKPLGVDLLINDQNVNQPGNIGIFQAKYSIPVRDSGLEIPISFTASNRTELIKEKEIRGNIGITFNLDKLFSRSK